MDDKPVPGAQARVIRPGDHRARQSADRLVGSYQARIVLRDDETSLTSESPTIADLEECIGAAVRERWPEYAVNVTAMRTDR